MRVRAINHYKHVHETKENLDWADLVTLDFGLFAQAGGKEELAKQLDQAVRNVGQ
jgi:hypothetical protein